MVAFAVLSGPLPKLGVIAVAALAGVVLVVRDDRTRAWAMLAALALAPVLLLAAIWHSPQLSVIHRHPLQVGVAAAVALLLVGAVAVAIHRRPWLIGPLAMLALPFRVPISAENTTSNLLVPLYFVVAAGSLAWIVPMLRSRDDRRRPQPHRFEQALAGFVLLYAVQAVYSGDFVKALQQVVFFYVPFALLLSLLRDLRWTRELLTRCLQVTVALALIFSAIGFFEYATKTVLLSSKVAEANDLHEYFTVNSVFLDPDIFGRYLALVMILLAGVLLWSRRPRLQIGSTLALAVIWGGLVLSLSRSSMGALLVGLAVLAAYRWRARPVLAAVGVVIAAGVIALAVSPHTFGLNQGLNNASAGRANLVTGGVRMFGQRPLYGYGSASFVRQYRRENRSIATTLAASHTIPITVAAEQGVIGLIVYAVLVLSAIIALVRGARGDPARVAIAAAFIGLILHTMLYADFLEDPVTWTLLGIGGALARAATTPAPGPRRTRVPAGTGARAAT